MFTDGGQETMEPSHVSLRLRPETPLKGTQEH
jgi:hypothetical protein